MGKQQGAAEETKGMTGAIYECEMRRLAMMFVFSLVASMCRGRSLASAETVGINPVTSAVCKGTGYSRYSRGELRGVNVHHYILSECTSTY
jgi:hypothetical protein